MGALGRAPEVSSRLLFERAPWDAIDTEFAGRIPGDSPTEHCDCLQKLCAEGKATSHRLILGGQRAGLLVTRVEEDAGRELVLVACYSAAPWPLSPILARAVEEMARAEGCTSIRFHTIRAGAARLAAELFGYRLTELVMRKTLPPVPPSPDGLQ